MYRPGDIFYSEFTTNNISGVSTNTDVTPWGTMVKNGLDDTSVAVFINNIDAGRYVVSGTIPSNYVKGQSVGVVISGYIGGSLTKNFMFFGQLDSKLVGDTPDVNVVTVSGQQVAPGLSGSITSDIRFVNGYPAFSYQGIAQTGGNNYIRLAASEASINDYYKNQYINIVLGKGAYQQAIITSYSGSTKDAYVRTPYSNNQWLTVPDNTSAYVLNGLADVNVISAIPGVTVSVTGQTSAVSTGSVTVTGIVPGLSISVTGSAPSNFIRTNSVSPGVTVSLTGSAPANFIGTNAIAPGVTVSVTGVVVISTGSFDNIRIENGLNARQALSIMSAVLAGSSTVAGNNITYYAVNNNTVNRVVSTAVSGARQAIVVFLP